MTLAIDQLTFERNDTLLFSEISFALKSGEALEIRGENGCGKSTLLRIIAGYIRPEIGSITWQHKNIYHHPDEYAMQISWLGHANGIKSQLTVLENLKLSSALSEIKIEDDILKIILRKMKLENLTNTQALYLSAGQKRRLALSRLLLAPTRLWILDEPTTSLDHAGIEIFTDMLHQHLSQGGMAVIATHQDLKIQNMQTLHLQHEDAAHV